MGTIKLPGFARRGSPRQSEFYLTYLDSAEWRARRCEIIEARGAECESCGADDEMLELHHLTYERLGNELDEDLVLLCERCHRRADRRRVRMTRRARGLATYVLRKYVDRGLEVPVDVEREFDAWLKEKKQRG